MIDVDEAGPLGLLWRRCLQPCEVRQRAGAAELSTDDHASTDRGSYFTVRPTSKLQVNASDCPCVEEMAHAAALVPVLCSSIRPPRLAPLLQQIRARTWPASHHVPGSKPTTLFGPSLNMTNFELAYDSPHIFHDCFSRLLWTRGLRCQRQAITNNSSYKNKKMSNIKLFQTKKNFSINIEKLFRQQATKNVDPNQ
jgi:hypothetical protein